MEVFGGKLVSTDTERENTGSKDRLKLSRNIKNK